MQENSLQVGKNRYTHYPIVLHSIWISKYHRCILAGGVQKERRDFPRQVVNGGVKKGSRYRQRMEKMDWKEDCCWSLPFGEFPDLWLYCPGFYAYLCIDGNRAFQVCHSSVSLSLEVKKIGEIVMNSRFSMSISL